MAFEIKASSSPTAAIELAFDVPAAYAPDAKSLRALSVMHWQVDPNTGQYAFVDVTTSREWDDSVVPVVRRLHASVTSLSPFVVAYTLRPTIDPIQAPSQPMPVNTMADLTASFTDATFADPTAGDTFTAVWIWGDGTQTAGTVTPPIRFSDGSERAGRVSGSHAYANAGVYTVTLSVSDGTPRGGTASSTHRYVVAYDPNGGFVTGGGWINSPAGALASNKLIAGKATFGFVSKYQKGATAPTGQTEFNFQVGALRFNSTVYEWLVIAGARAQYKGSGTVNGSGDYGFLLTAIDGEIRGGGSADKFRLKVWQKATGEVVYDNETAPDDADPTTSIGGGSIVIHK
jgi:hypothetical protein